MKHLKLFEDYTDNELKDLIGELSTIGHKHQLVKGEDYGFGKDMDLENNGKNPMVFTDYAISELVKGGIINDNPKPYTSGQRFYIPDPLSFETDRIFFHRGYAKEVLDGKRYAYLIDWTTGREFPIEANEKGRFIGADRVKKIYEILEKKVKELRF